MIMRGKKSGQSKTSQSVLRHKVRNLRAKVRLLLPMNMCFKYQKRTKNLVKMSHNYELQQQMRLKKWNHKRQNPMQFYIPKGNVVLQKHLFHKLTNAQIDQIKEDKHYYVGEQFLSQFDSFLESREREKHAKLAHISSVNNLKPIASLIELSHHSGVAEANTCTNFDKQNVNNANLRNAIKFDSFLNKRKLLTEEDITKRAIIRLKRQQKQERYRANLQRSNAKKQEQIKKRNQLDMLRTSNSIKNREVFLQRGEMNHLSQKLRLICLNRSSKSANMLYRL